MNTGLKIKSSWNNENLKLLKDQSQVFSTLKQDLTPSSSQALNFNSNSKQPTVKSRFETLEKSVSKIKTSKREKNYRNYSSKMPSEAGHDDNPN